ncbi:MAG: PilZ domain-containing protein [Candidatus Acidiferrales bacterium]
MGDLPAKLDFLHPEKDRRRSQRVLIVIPALVSWTTKDGVRIKEEAHTEVISRHGAMLRVKGSMTMGAEVELTRPQARLSTKAKVVWVGKPDADGFVRVGLELTVPSAEFWGVYLPPTA